MELNQFLRQPMQELEVSKAFISNAETMGFKTLEEILTCQPRELFDTPGFSYIWFEELIVLLKKHEILHLLQPTPGRSAY